MIFLLTFNELDTGMSGNYIICLFAERNLPVILNGHINSSLCLWVHLQSKSAFPYIILHFWHQLNNTHLEFIQIFYLSFTVNAPVFLLQDEKNQRMTTNVWMKQASLTLRKLFFLKSNIRCVAPVETTSNLHRYQENPVSVSTPSFDIVW